MKNLLIKFWNDERGKAPPVWPPIAALILMGTIYFSFWKQWKLLASSVMDQSFYSHLIFVITAIVLIPFLNIIMMYIYQFLEYFEEKLFRHEHDNDETINCSYYSSYYYEGWWPLGILLIMSISTFNIWHDQFAQLLLNQPFYFMLAMVAFTSTYLLLFMLIGLCHILYRVSRVTKLAN